MILDTIKHCHRYFDSHPGFKEAFNFILKTQSQPFLPCRLELEGTHIIAIVESGEGKSRNGARLEAHRKYIDIQFTFSGTEEIGWSPLNVCRTISHPYNPEKDIEFFSDIPLCWLPIPQHSFAIFFPDDAHAPLATKENVNKIIMKVPLNPERIL